MRLISVVSVVAGLLLSVGCSPAPQVLTGRIDPGFPSTITSVKVTTSSIQSWHGDALVTIAPVAADGSFRLETPPLDRVHLLLLADNGKSTVVFPRQVGSIQSAFNIRANGAAFDLGRIRYVGDSSTTTYAFRIAGGTTGDAECEDDGMDANGAMCVDDEDDNQNTCGQNDENEQEGEHEDGDGDGEHEDGENDDGENDDGEHEDGENDDGEHENGDPEDGPDMGDAVAEHNFPADGCSDDDEEDDDDEEEND